MSDPRRLRGVDVSTYQGVISHAVAEGLVELGCSFAFIRAAIGTNTRPDDRFAANVQVFDDVGIPLAPYTFVYPRPDLDPIAQAHLHWSICANVGARDGDMSPLIDLEWPPPETKLSDSTIERTWIKMGCSGPQIRDWFKRYADELDRLSGRVSSIYTYRYFDQRAGLGLDPEISTRSLVLADYSYKGRIPDDAACAALKIPPGWVHLLGWQHDGDGGLRLPVSSADVDWNVMPDPEDLAEQRKLPSEPAPLEHDQELADLALASHIITSGFIVEDAIRDYRRERIDVAA